MHILLQVPQEEGQLGDLVAAIDGVLAREGVPGAVVHDVQLVTEEVVCNALDYGRVEGREHEISVGIAIRDGLITLWRDYWDAPTLFRQQPATWLPDIPR